MTIAVEKLRVAGWKSIKDTTINLGSLTLLVGANGAGKSNLVGLVGLLGAIVEQRLQLAVRQQGGAATLVHFGPKTTPTIHIGLALGPGAYEATLAVADDDSLYFQDELAEYYTPTGSVLVGLGHGHRESALPAAAKDFRRIGGASVLERLETKHTSDEPHERASETAQKVLERLKGCRVFHFHDTTPSAPVKRPCRIDENAELRADAANLAAVLYLLSQKDEPAYRRIVAAIRDVAPFFDDFALRPDPLAPDTIKLEWRDRGSDAGFGPNSLSDGTLRFICLAALLLHPSPPALLLIDEPELGLHPFAITKLAGLLSAASTRTQLLVATQSVTLMNQFDADTVLVVDRRDNASEFRRLSVDELAAWTDEYSLGELWEKNLIGGRPQRA